MKNECSSSLDQCLYFTANSLARIVNKLAEEEFMMIGLAPSPAFIQMLANQNPGIAPNEIAARMNLAPSTVTRFIDRLQERALIRRETTGKASKIYPTQKGLDLQADIEKAWASLHERMIAILGQDFTKRLTEDTCSAYTLFIK